MNLTLPALAVLTGDYGVPVGVGAPDSVRGYGDSPLLASWRDKVQRGIPTTLPERNVAVASLAWAADIIGEQPATRPEDRRGPLLVDLGPRGQGLVLGVGGFTGGSVALPTARPAGAAVAPTGGGSSDYLVVDGAMREAFWRDARCALFGMRLRPEDLVAAPRGDTEATLVAPAGWQVLVGVVVLGGIAALAVYRTAVNAQELEARREVESVRIREEGLRDRTAMALEAKSRAFAQRLAFYRETGYLPPETDIERAPLPQPAQQQLADWRSQLATGAVKAALGVGLAGVAVGGAAWSWDRDEQRRAARQVIRSDIGALGIRPPELG